MDFKPSLAGTPLSQSAQQPVVSPGTEVVVKQASKQPIQSIADLKRAELQGNQVSVSEEQLIKAIDRAIKALQGRNTYLDFSVHEVTHQIMVKVLDKETNEVIREVPPEKMVDFVAKLWEMAGILIDVKR